MKELGAQAVNEYLARVPEPARGTLDKLRKTIRAAAPKEATEGMSYGMPTFFHCGALVAYGAFKNHCSLFPMNGRLVEEMSEELKGYKTSKGAIQFGVDKALPAGLVNKIVKKRAAENEGKSRGSLS